MRPLQTLVVAAALAVGAAGADTATPALASSLTLEATFTSPQNGWAQVERWNDSTPGFAAAQYLADGRLDQKGQEQTFFGTAEPTASHFLLFYGSNWNTNTGAYPVLLVHGAFENADWSWANPSSSPLGCGASTCPTTGLMQYLSSRNYRVFAISFPDAVGDNYDWSQQIADAIQVIKSRSGAAKVDIVSWSKGTFASRMYVSSLHQSWGTAYQGDVRRLVEIAGLNGGYDWAFRHGTNPDAWIYPECGGTVLGGAASLTATCYGVLDSHPELTIYSTSSGDHYPGLRQMTARWDGVYAIESAAPDASVTYYGGTGLYSSSYGAQYAVNQGSLVSALQNAGVPSSVTVDLLCGGAANIPNWYNEDTGPSDGTVFTASCQLTTGLPVIGYSTWIGTDNHLQLPWESTAMGWVVTFLS